MKSNECCLTNVTVRPTCMQVPVCSRHRLQDRAQRLAGMWDTLVMGSIFSGQPILTYRKHTQNENTENGKQLRNMWHSLKKCFLKTLSFVSHRLVCLSQFVSTKKPSCGRWSCKNDITNRYHIFGKKTFFFLSRGWIRKKTNKYLKGKHNPTKICATICCQFKLYIYQI